MKTGLFNDYHMDAKSMYPNIIIKPLSDMIKDDIVDKPEETKPEDWVWVRGFKGTDANMNCRDTHYELNKVYEMGDDVEICNKGYHLCLNLKDVFSYYNVQKGNRFFEVSALVKRRDYEDMKANMSPSLTCVAWLGKSTDKIVAKSIIFLRELSVDEVFNALDGDGYKDWTEVDKKEAMMIGTRKVRERINTKKLIDLGYNEIFAAYLVDNCKFDVAYAVANQPGLSMEMKCLAIFAGGSDD